jgi:dGTPase
MEWIKLMSSDKLGDVRSTVDEPGEGRNSFQRDYDRIIFSTAFRRLQHKTQLIPLPYSDHVHNRLTHSLEVSCIGRSLGMKVGLEIAKRHPELKENNIEPDDFSYVLAAACLAHDIGNPPLGHSGEDAISYYFCTKGKEFLHGINREKQRDLTTFEGNAMGFRILTHTSPNESNFQGGMGLSYATLAAYSKYPCESHKKDSRYGHKYGYFQSDTQNFELIAQKLGLINTNSTYMCWCRHPLAFLSDAADEICYLIMDLEDGYKEKFITFDKTRDLLWSICDDKIDGNDYRKIHENDRRIKYLRGKAINVLIEEVSNVFLEQETQILEGSFTSQLLKNIPSTPILKDIRKEEKYKLYKNQEVIQIEAAGFEVLPGLLEIFLTALNKPKLEKSKKIFPLIPKQYFNKGGRRFSDPYENILGVIQYVSNMTDKYAIDTYRLLKGISISGY